ncbi:MAG TPA: flagellar hook-length control protein FliK [Defluviitoga sp.]|nr:flagellar hook-length control protein FliK [Defluviitoga sp.]HOP24818.1 flagellar hook-length control protein FliK [Defluviitoga sp.]HPZ28272.1 flagellar hook-length control protein FliK [Defluviitoga sp.]HQD62162.1 flagellar hook-length control protein FliK [Defluviitoga sp.]
METNSIGAKNLFNIMSISKVKTNQQVQQTSNHNSSIVSFQKELKNILIPKNTLNPQKQIENKYKNNHLEKLMQKSEIFCYLNILLSFTDPKINLETIEGTTYLKIFNKGDNKTITFNVKELINYLNKYVDQKKISNTSNDKTSFVTVKEALKILSNIENTKGLSKKDTQILLNAIDITTKHHLNEIQESITNIGTILHENEEYFESIGIKINILPVETIKKETVNLIIFQKDEELIITPMEEFLSSKIIEQLNDGKLLAVSMNLVTKPEDVSPTITFLNNFSDTIDTELSLFSDLESTQFDETFEVNNIMKDVEISQLFLFLPKKEFSQETLKKSIINHVLNINVLEKTEKEYKIISNEFEPYKSMDKKTLTNQKNYTTNIVEKEKSAYFDIQESRKVNYIAENNSQTKTTKTKDHEIMENSKTTTSVSNLGTDKVDNIHENTIKLENNQTKYYSENTTYNNHLSETPPSIKSYDLNGHIKDIIVTKNTETFFKESFSVNVSPPNLGKVDIQIVKNGEAITINLITENETAKSTISKTVQSLVGNLRDEGYNPVDVKIIVHQEENYLDYQNQKNQDQQQNQEKRYRQNEQRDETLYTFEEFLRSDLNV